ncbi:MAG: LCP family protein [Bacillota bacterium]|jgi:LCP family protein required for cell wall assembly
MSKKNKKRAGSKVAIIILVILIIVVAYAGFSIWLDNYNSLVPDRSDDSDLLSSETRINILIMGTDVNDLIKDTGRADSIMVAGIDLKHKNVSLLSLPRDSYVEIPGHGLDKINHSFAYGGIDSTKETVKNLLNIPIDYYVVTNFNGFKEIVDILGGVEIDVDKRMYHRTYDGVIDLQPGLQVLDGEKALQYVRFRSDAMGDVKRVERQRIFISAIIKEALAAENISKLPQVITKLDKVLESDLNAAQMLKLGKIIQDIPAESLQSATAPGNFGSISGISYWMLDKEELDNLVFDFFVADPENTEEALNQE